MVVFTLSKSLKYHAKAEIDEVDAEKSIKKYILFVVNTSGTGKGKPSGTQISSAITTPSSAIDSTMIQLIVRKIRRKTF